MANQPQPSENPWGDLPPESTEFGFPLYLNLTEYNADVDEWWRVGDEVSFALYDWCIENLVGDIAEGYVPLSDDTKIYINGGLVDEIIMDYGLFLFYGESLPFAEVGIASRDNLYGYGAKLPSSGGIETTLQFPLYIYFDKCSEVGFYKYCIADGDFSELCRYLKECAIAYGESFSGGYSLNTENYPKLGDIYIEDEEFDNIAAYDGYEYIEYSTASGNISGVIHPINIDGEMQNF